MYFILADSIKSRVAVLQCDCVWVCAHVAALRAEGSAAEDPLIELAVITGVAAGFPGICSPTEHALPASGFHTYIHTDSHTLKDKHAHTHANAPSATYLSVSWVLKMHVWCRRSLDSKCKMHVHILRQAN